MTATGIVWERHTTCAARLRAARAAAELSAVDAAEKLGIHEKTLRSYEREPEPLAKEKTPRLELLNAMAELYGVDAQSLAWGTLGGYLTLSTVDDQFITVPEQRQLDLFEVHAQAGPNEWRSSWTTTPSLAPTAPTCTSGDFPQTPSTDTAKHTANSSAGYENAA